MPLKDGSRIIYVNAKNKGREELDNLMQSLVARDYREMKDDVIRGITMYYKTTLEGEDHVCEAVQNYAEKYARKRAEESYNDGVNNGKTEGINIGRSEGVVQTLLNLVTKGSITLDSAITDSGLKKEEFYSIAKTLGFDL